MEPITRMVPQVQEHLDALKARLLVMGGLAEERVRLVTAALVDRDADLAARVQGSDQPLDPGTTREAHARNRRVTFVVDQVTPEEPDPNARASVSDCDVPAPVDHCAAGGSAGGG